MADRFLLLACYLAVLKGCAVAVTVVQGEVEGGMSTLETWRNAAAIQELYRLTAGNQPLLSNADYGKLSVPCRNHTEVFASLNNIKAMYMEDARAKVPDGILYGSYVHMGNYDECVDVRDFQSDAGVFHGQYCLASVTVKKSAMAQRTMLILVYLSFRALQMGVCVPSSCTASDTTIIARGLYQELLSKMPMLELNVGEHDCHTADKPEYRTQDWVAIAILICFGVMVVGSTCYDLLNTDAESRSELLLAFSVYTNGKKLLVTSKSDDSLHCLHGIRFISMAWVVYGHSYMHSVSISPAINLMTFSNKFIPGWEGIGVTNGNLSVDTFFLLGGLLVAYVFFRQVPRTKSFNILLYYVHRYVRLTPAYAIVILLVATLWRYTGSGPNWDALARAEQANCEERWWANLLYVQNYVRPDAQCVSQGWYLAVDMQLHWLSPLVLIPLWKWPKVGKLLMVAVMVGGLVTNFVITYVNEFRGDYIGAVTADADHSYSNYVYYPVYARFMPYIIGIGLGYLLVDIKKKGRTVKLSKLRCLLLWLAGAGFMLLSLLIVHIFQQQDYVYEPVGPAFYNSFGRPVWAFGVAIIIFLCATGHGGFANTLLSWEWFQVLGRLCYSVYLLHMSVEISQYGSLHIPLYLDDMTLIPRFIADLVISLILAVPLSLVFESPFIVLEKELLGGKKPPVRRAAAPAALPDVESAKVGNPEIKSA